MRLIKSITATLIFVCSIFNVVAQESKGSQMTLTGRVINEQGEGVEYATIALAGDSIGTLADGQGYFSITIPSGKKNDLSITHVSYEKACISYSTYQSGHPLAIQMKSKNVELNEVIIGKKNKLKTILGKKLMGPTCSIRGKGQENWLEWGPTFKCKKDWVVSNIFFTIKKSTFRQCVLSFTIYEMRGNEFINILNKPIYKTIAVTDKKTKLNMQPQENIVLKAGRNYYIGVTVVDSDDTGILEFGSQMRSSYARRISSGKGRKLPVGPIITLMGYELNR